MGKAQGLVLRDYGIPTSGIWGLGFGARTRRIQARHKARGLLNVVKHAKESRRMLKTRWSIPNLTVYRVSEEVQVASTARVGSKAP